MTKTIERSIYTNMLKGFFGAEPIKVITGIRRSGKSEILKLFKAEALKNTYAEHVIFINFEDSYFDGLTTYKELNGYIEEKIKDENKYYIFLDEIQSVENWEKSVNSLRLRNTDIYVTGSNSSLLSGELATLLAGRYVAFNVQPLTFSEFIRFRRESGFGTDDDDKELEAYIAIGGFPILSVNNLGTEQCRQVVTDINASAVLKDVVARNKVRNVSLMEKLIAFLYDNVGNLVSVTKISSYLKNQRSGADFDTVNNYIGYLEQACIIRRARRYDVKGKKLLESNDKYYLADHSLQYAIRDRRKTNLPGILENIVYNELTCRGYQVYVGKLDEKEVDFVAERASGGERLYIQVCTEFKDGSTVEREFKPLQEIKDHHHKYVVTLDKYWKENIDGVIGIHLKDFLQKTDY